MEGEGGSISAEVSITISASARQAELVVAENLLGAAAVPIRESSDEGLQIGHLGANVCALDGHSVRHGH